MPLPALGELPQLTALSQAWRRLVDVKPVLMVVNNTSLVCCWDQGGRWQQRVVAWPDGVCRWQSLLLFANGLLQVPEGLVGLRSDQLLSDQCRTADSPRDLLRGGRPLSGW